MEPNQMKIRSNIPQMIMDKREFAAQCFRHGLSYDTIRRLREGSTNINLNTLFTVADIFGCKIDVLFERVNGNTP